MTVAGGDAQSLLKREGSLPPDRVAAIISPVAWALDAAHHAGLVHRDVKPSNMLMDVQPGRPDHVYLSDFGLSKAVASTSGMTRAGMVMGTLDYIPPEQIAGKQRGHVGQPHAVGAEHLGQVVEQVAGLDRGCWHCRQRSACPVRCWPWPGRSPRPPRRYPVSSSTSTKYHCSSSNCASDTPVITTCHGHGPAAARSRGCLRRTTRRRGTRRCCATS